MSLTQSIHRGKHMYGDTPALVFGQWRLGTVKRLITVRFDC